MTTKDKKRYRPKKCPFCNGNTFDKIEGKYMWKCTAVDTNGCYGEFRYEGE